MSGQNRLRIRPNVHVSWWLEDVKGEIRETWSWNITSSRAGGLSEEANCHCNWDFSFQKLGTLDFFFCYCNMVCEGRIEGGMEGVGGS